MAQVHEQAAEPTIEFLQCAQSDFFVETNKSRANVNSIRDERLARNEAADSTCCVPDKSRRLAGNPAYERGENPEFTVRIRAGGIKTLVQHRLQHALNRPDIFVRSDQSKYPSDSSQRMFF